LSISSQYAENLLRALTCHVRRASALLIFWSSIPCWQLAGAFRQEAKALGVPSLTNVPAMGALTDHCRAVAKNHSLSCTIGPPCEKLTS
jgi:hypothetical protein